MDWQIVTAIVACVTLIVFFVSVLLKQRKEIDGLVTKIEAKADAKDIAMNVEAARKEIAATHSDLVNRTNDKITALSERMASVETLMRLHVKEAQ
jgi:hypothetical protein